MGQATNDRAIRATRLGVVAAALVAAGFIVHATKWSFLCDDAFISFRYADNLAHHGELVFNPSLQERVEGYSNFLWVVVLALGATVGLAPHTLAPVLTWIASAAGLGVVVVLCRQLRALSGDEHAARDLRAIDFIPAALLAASPEYVVWQSGGLESSLATTLALAAMVAWLGDRWVLAAAAAGLCGLTRTDALLPIALFGLAWLVVFVAPSLRGQGNRVTVPWRRVVPAALAFGVPMIAHLLWRRAYYGTWLPNTWTVKAHGAALRGSYGAPYVRAWLEAVGALYLVPLAVLLRPRHIALLVPIGGIVYYVWSVGGDFMAYSRFFLTATVLMACLVGWLLSDVERILRARAPLGLAQAAPLVLAAGLCGVLAYAASVRWAADRSKTAGWLAGRWEGVTVMDRFALVGFHVGTWMAANLPGDTLVTVGAAGALPYASRLPTVDAYGLNDPTISRHPDMRVRTDPRARPGHQLWAPASYIRARDPDLLCHVGHRGAKRPGRARAFRTGYTWACIEPGVIDDPRGPDDSVDLGFYCCRRPIDRTVGPFGEEAHDG